MKGAFNHLVVSTSLTVKYLFILLFSIIAIWLGIFLLFFIFPSIFNWGIVILLMIPVMSGIYSGIKS
ncbi:hypothetical protein PA42_14210 [Pasteurella canis]|uniref:Uncharacterized protein n=1 Tax=Pasteurella canis TaxID=753 RepID=A0ABQ4VLQ0_9PAST|nr:hypothetical protein PA42_14210 [Pasteurella canis]